MMVNQDKVLLIIYIAMGSIHVYKIYLVPTIFLNLLSQLNEVSKFHNPFLEGGGGYKIRGDQAILSKKTLQ